MYTAVDLLAPQRPAMVIPRKAVHEGRVYIAGADDRLAIRAVAIQLTQDDIVVLQSGIEEDERVIVTDLTPVIDGMPLQVIPAPEAEAELQRHALGVYR
jgi:hypothetical protein